ncbi:MAG: hypothetical protein SGI77_18290 [Pirellulaceae bacterium]|nr:hypothetical protein [Pirellulaceae bacterium]
MRTPILNKTNGLIVLLCVFSLSSYCYGQSVPLLQEIVLPQELEGRENASVLLRIPKTFIAKSVNRDFEHTAPIQRETLGTRSKGTAYCRGSVTCELMEHANGAQMCCRISGTVTSTTCGTNGPAIIQADATTQYTALKYALFDGHRFTTRPTSIQLTTRVKITGIGSSLPGLRGRIVRRFASKRAAESHHQVESITANLTAQELCQNIDIDFDERIRSLNEKLQKNLSILKLLDITGERLSIRSSPEMVEVGVLAKTHEGERLVIARRPIFDSVELWLKLSPSSMEKRLTIAQLLNSAPRWFASYLDDHPRLSKLDKKIDVDLYEDWIVLNLER